MSNELSWSDEYSVGVEDIDAQHKTLFALIEKLRDAIHAKRGSAACVEILDELVTYTQEHFTLEEAFMRGCGFPDHAAHEERHRELIATVSNMRQKIAGGAAISFELLHFLRTWLTKHILTEDKAYALFLERSAAREKRSGASVARQEPAATRKWWKVW